MLVLYSFCLGRGSSPSMRGGKHWWCCGYTKRKKWFLMWRASSLLQHRLAWCAFSVGFQWSGLGPKICRRLLVVGTYCISAAAPSIIIGVNRVHVSQVVRAKWLPEARRKAERLSAFLTVIFCVMWFWDSRFAGWIEYLWYFDGRRPQNQAARVYLVSCFTVACSLGRLCLCRYLRWIPLQHGLYGLIFLALLALTYVLLFPDFLSLGLFVARFG